MTSEAHQWLVVWAIRRMASDGFLVGGFEGAAPSRGASNTLPAPFELHGHRPDAWASSDDGARLAFAEAKTAGDIDNAHTRKQLRIFGCCRMRGSAQLCPLYLAIPRSAVYELDRVLIDTRLIGARHIVRVHIPDILLQESLHVARKVTSPFLAASGHRN
jgi:hypothetical protein